MLPVFEGFHQFINRFRNAAHLLSHRARDGQIITIYGDLPENDEAQNMICVRNTIRVETMSMMFHLLSVLTQIAVLSETLFCASPFARRPLQNARTVLSRAFFGKDGACMGIFNSIGRSLSKRLLPLSTSVSILSAKDVESCNCRQILCLSLHT